MSRFEGRRYRAEDGAVVDAARAGDESAFSGLVERYRRELGVHCYRMLGNFEDSEDMVQETFLRAWRRRESFQGRSTFRAWLYRISTNVCLDFLDRQPRARQVASATDYDGAPPPAMVPWLQAYPDRLLEGIAPGDCLAYDKAEWNDALVVVERGEIEPETTAGGRRRFGSGDALSLARLPLHILRNRGEESAVLVAVSRCFCEPTD